jgi:ABC-type sugar transport system permease subunit
MNSATRQAKTLAVLRPEPPSAFRETKATRNRLLRRRRQAHTLAGWLFVSPALVMVATFAIYPIFDTLLDSLYDWDGFSAERTYVGLSNFAEAAADQVFWNSLLRNTLWVLFLLIAVVLGVAIAILLWSRPRGSVLFQITYMVPEMMGSALVGVIWYTLWQPVIGGAAGIGQALHIDWMRAAR